MKFAFCTRLLLASACLFAASAFSVYAAEVGGVKLDDTVTVANQELRLNGAGIRYKAIFKVYVAGLYVNGKKTTVPEILAASGPRRMAIVMLRDVSSADFSESFMAGIQNNSDSAEQAKLANQLKTFKELFATIPAMKKGDVLAADWIPGSGMQVLHNGKKLVEGIPDIAFYNAFLKIWLGEKPADSDLKRQLSGTGQ